MLLYKTLGQTAGICSGLEFLRKNPGKPGTGIRNLVQTEISEATDDKKMGQNAN